MIPAPPCRCLGEWRLIHAEGDETQGKARFRWFVVERAADCSIYHPEPLSG